MQRVEQRISFRPVVTDDLPMLRSWMEQSHWREWWGDTDVELGYIVDMLEGRDTTKPFIFQVNNVDMGYIQYWTVGDNLVEPWLSDAPWMTALAPETIGVDLSIGDHEHLSKGIGTAVLSAFVEMLQGEGFEKIIIDPDCRNLRAIRAYEKAGFQKIDALFGNTDDTLLMQFGSKSVIQQ